MITLLIALIRFRPHDRLNDIRRCLRPASHVTCAVDRGTAAITVRRARSLAMYRRVRGSFITTRTHTDTPP